MVEKRSKRKRCKKGTCIALLLVKNEKKIIIDYEYIYRSVPGMQQRHFVYIKSAYCLPFFVKCANVNKNTE